MQRSILNSVTFDGDNVYITTLSEPKLFTSEYQAGGSFTGEDVVDL